jgi:exodeoxyribonuclease VII small subunit
MTDQPDDVASLSFETALAELEKIVDQLEKGQAPLEDSIRLYARGEALKKRCEALLKNAEARIEKITLGADGSPKGTAPLDMQ